MDLKSMKERLEKEIDLREHIEESVLITDDDEAQCPFCGTKEYSLGLYSEQYTFTPSNYRKWKCKRCLKKGGIIEWEKEMGHTDDEKKVIRDLVRKYYPEDLESLVEEENPQGETEVQKVNQEVYKELKDKLGREVNLKDHLISEGCTFTGGNKTLCPFCASPEPSLEVRFFDKKGKWAWKCHGCRKYGSIIEWKKEKYKITEEEAIKKLVEKYYLGEIKTQVEDVREEPGVQEPVEELKVEEDKVRPEPGKVEPVCADTPGKTQGAPPKKTKKKKVRKGYEPLSGFVQLDNMMMESACWTTLSERAVWLYIMVRKQYRFTQGGNSHLVLPYVKVREKMSTHAFTDGMRELVHYGFLKLVEMGGFPRRPSVYALSDEWKEISKKIVSTEGREAIRLGLAPKKRSRNRLANLVGKRVWEKKDV